MRELPQLLTPAETAALLRVQPQTLRVWRCKQRHGLPYVKAGSKVLYRVEDVVAFIERRKHNGGEP